MGKVYVSVGGGGGAGSDDCTASKDKVLSGYTAITNDSDDEQIEGTMANQGAVSHALNAGGTYTVPAGYHNGSGKVTANSLASQTSATATAGDVLSGKTAYVSGNKITGTMTNRGAVTQALNAGGSYTVPAGYHNGSGKVTANSLASQTGGATAGDGDVLTGKTYWKDGTKRTGSMANQGAKTSSLNCGGSYTIPAGYHNGSGKVTANSLSSQTSATATAAQVISGKTAWVNGSKLTGTLAVTSAITFSAAALSYNTIRISWKNPAKGPWQGVFIQMSTSGYPGTGGGSRVYTGRGTNGSQANGNNYVDISGLAPNTLYYFTCTSYCDGLGWGTSHNVNYRTLKPNFRETITAINISSSRWLFWPYDNKTTNRTKVTSAISWSGDNQFAVSSNSFSSSYATINALMFKYCEYDTYTTDNFPYSVVDLLKSYTSMNIEYSQYVNPSTYEGSVTVNINNIHAQRLVIATAYRAWYIIFSADMSGIPKFNSIRVTMN